MAHFPSLGYQEDKNTPGYKRMAKHVKKLSHDKALSKMAGKGNVLKGKNIEGDKSRRAAKMLGISHKEHLDFKKKHNL